MSDSAEFILKLNEQVAGPAKKAADALRAFNVKADNAVRKMGLAQHAAEQMNKRMNDVSASKAARALNEQSKAAEKAAASIRRMGLVQMQANKMNEAADKAKKGNTFFGGFGQKLGFRSVADYAKGAFIGDLAAKGVETIIGGFVSGARAAVGLVADGVKMAFHEGGKAENLRLSYKLLLGDKGGRGALNDIGRFAGKTKYDDDAIAEMMRPLYNAGLKGTGARSAFAASGDLEAAGLGDASGFIDQFAKIQLKGGVTEKLLVGMGINLRDFKTALAEETHTKDKEAAFKKATEGKSDPQAIMNAIYTGIEKRQGGKIGTGTELSGKTMSARLQKLADLPSQYLKKMSESSAWTTLSDKVGDVLKGLDPESERGGKIMASLFNVFNKLAEVISRTLTPENLDAFAMGAAAAINALTKIPEVLASIYRISRDVALIWAGVRLATGVNAFASALTAALGASSAVAAGGAAVGAGGVAGAAGVFSGIATAAAAAVAPLAAVALALGSVYLAYQQIKLTIDQLGGWDKVKDDWKQFDGKRMAENDDAEAAHDRKYGGAGSPLNLAPRVAAANSNAAPVVLNFGDVQMSVDPGTDPKQQAAALFSHTKDNFSQALERANASGGG